MTIHVWYASPAEVLRASIPVIVSQSHSYVTVNFVFGYLNCGIASVVKAFHCDLLGAQPYALLSIYI